MLDNAQLVVLRNELDTDPLGRGYVSMDERQAADDLNLPFYMPLDGGVTVTADEILAAIDFAEYEVLVQADRDAVALALQSANQDEVIQIKGSGARNMVVNAFTGSPNTIAAFSALQTVAENRALIGRAAVLGLGIVTHANVGFARQLP